MQLIGESLITALTNHCNNLTELTLKHETQDDIDDIDQRLSQVFRNNENLKFLSLRDFFNLTGECFLSLNENVIEEIVLYFMEEIEPVYLKKCFPVFEKLHALTFSNYTNNINNHEIAECIQLCPKLKSLTLEDFRTYSEKELIQAFFCQNLEMINLDCRLYNNSEVVVDNFCQYISSNLLNLRFLEIKSSSDLSDNGLESISKLPKLEALDLSCCENITGLAFTNLFNLKKLNCSNCTNLKDDGLIALLESATNLELLDVSGSQISNALVDVAIEVTNNRMSNVLKMGIQGTKVDVNKIKTKSPFLHLDRYI